MATSARSEVELPPTEGRVFAVLPAAGRSTRMGRHKLLLPLGDGTVIGQLLQCLRSADTAEILVVIRPDDSALSREIARHGAHVVRPPSDPQSMRHSVQYALTELERRFAPTSQDAWLLVPADHPVLSARVLEQLLRCWREGDSRVLVPIYQQRRGHPTLFAWSLAAMVPQIPSDCGLNWLLQECSQDVTELMVDDPSVLLDLDTPDEYARLVAEWRTERE